MRGKFILVIFSLILISNFSCAQFVFSEEGSSISTQYTPSEHLKARINISFQEESLNSSFTDSLGNSINISDLIILIPEFDYTLDSGSQKISSDFYLIQFDVAKFSLPNTIGTLEYQLDFGGSKIFEEEISIISSNNSIQFKIDEKKELLNETKLEIKKFDYLTEQMLYKELGISNLEIELNKIENDYQKAISPEEYEKILNNLSKIQIPKSVQEIKNSTPLSFYPKEEFINLDFLASIAGNGNYTSENSDKYKNALNTWYADNLKTKVTFKEILIKYDEINQSTLKIFEFEFDKRELKNDAYFIIEDLQDISFGGEYSEKKSEGYIYIELKGISEIVLSTKKDINFMTLPVFIAPSLENIEILGPIQEWKPIYWFILFGLIIFLILLISIIVYIGIQMWYRRRYENALFKNRNNLYNIMTYIQHSKKKGMSRENIMKNLKKAKWRREQINYALNKYEGKKIAGIIERPFKKILEEIDNNPDKYPKK